MNFGVPQEGNPAYEKFEPYLEISPPECFSLLYGRFISLYNASDGVITPATIREYEDLKQFRFTLYEIDLIFRMKSWANDEKQKLEKEVANVV